ncbi:MAG: sodium:solute symporter family protein [Planctomycetota bacterium]
MTNFTWFDGLIVGIYLVATMVAGVWMRKYVGKVEHFLVAGREMNVYLGIASLAATEFGVVTCMYTAQGGYEKGFAGMVPGITNFLAMLIVGWTGFCVKPLRDSGVITIPELLHRRFGERIRWLAGVVIVLGGLLNMGVFLRMGGEFLVNVMGLDALDWGNDWVNAHKLELMMTVLLGGVALYTVLGGMLSVLVTDFLQFVVMSGGLLVVTILILANVGWSRLVDTVQTNYGAAGFSPFKHPDMGWPYVMFNLLGNTAAVLTWQATIARVLSAKDTATGRKVYTRTSFFFLGRWVIPGLWGIAALAMLQPGGESLQAMPRFLSTFVPMGLMGLLVAAMLAADMSTDSSYMLTWGGVIYNDILEPVHKGRWSEKKGLRANRIIIALIGVFLLVYGLWYKLEGALWDYLLLTGTIYLASISTLLIACCYWRKANSWGAGAAIVVGAAIPLGFLVMQKLPRTALLAQDIGPHWSGIAAYVATGLAMVIGSLLKPQSAAMARQN